MKPPAKRQRVEFGFTNRSSPPHNTPSHNKGQRNEEVEMVDDEEIVEDFEADEDLQTQRARLDYKLKSTFEAIFEKYGKDFDGIGDEIDLNTGRILVNNGHLLKMQHERDAGEADSHTSSLDDSNTASDDDDMEAASSELDEDVTELEEGEEEDEEDEEDEVEEEEEEEEGDNLSDGDMIEDDMILRGFSQASQFIHKKLPPEQDSFMDGFAEHLEVPRPVPASRPTAPSNVLPSRAEILSQFGPQLGPEIVNYVKDKGGLDDNSIEPAWRAPPIATSRAEKHSKPRPAIRKLENERSPSPDYSVWATNNTRGKPTRSRTNFTEEEDALLLDFVAEVRQLGLDLWAHQTWKIIAAKHPHHNYIVWRNRYRHKYTYLHAADVDEGMPSNSETSTKAVLLPVEPWQLPARVEERRLSSSKTISGMVATIMPSWPIRRGHMNRQAPSLEMIRRPTRERKQVQRDPTILDWSEAVASIESVDPALHSSLLRDVQRADSGAPFRYAYSASPPTPSMTGDKKVEVKQHSSKYVQQSSAIITPQRPVKNSPIWLDDANEVDELAEDTTVTPRHAFVLSKGKRCTYKGCNSSPKTYRLHRAPNEELSPMCLHLLQAHQITPFPCKESFCDRTGALGFCLQVDLVRHVRIAHPSPEALNRLRGRVSLSYVVEDYDITNSNLPPNINIPTIPVLETESTWRTLTDTEQQDHSVNTPLGIQCGEGNWMLNPHELAPKPQENSTKSVDPTTLSGLSGFPYKDASPDCHILNEHPFSIAESTAKQNQFDPALIVEKQTLAADTEVVSRQLAQAPKDKSTQQIVEASARNTIDPSYEFSDDDDFQPINKRPQPIKKAFFEESLSQATEKHNFEKTINGSHAAEVSGMIEQIKAEDIEEDVQCRHINGSTGLHPAQEHFNEPGTLKQPVKHDAGKLEISRTTERTVNQLNTDILISTPEDQHITQGSSHKEHADVKIESTDCSMYNGEITSLDQRSPFTTPTKTKRKPRKSILKNVACSDELDELSPCADDFVLLYSKPRSGIRHGSGLQVRSKREDKMDEPTSVLAKRKRKFASLVNDDEIDELGGDEPVFLRSLTRRPKCPSSDKIKKETSSEIAAVGGSATSVNNMPTNESHSSRAPMRLEESAENDFPSSPTRRPRGSNVTVKYGC